MLDIYMVVSNRAYWRILFEIEDDDGPIDLSGMDIYLSVVSDCARVDASTVNGMITIPDVGEFYLVVPEAAARQFEPGQARVGAVIKVPGETDQIGVGLATIIDGVVP